MPDLEAEMYDKPAEKKSLKTQQSVVHVDPKHKAADGQEEDKVGCRPERSFFFYKFIYMTLCVVVYLTFRSRKNINLSPF